MTGSTPETKNSGIRWIGAIPYDWVLQRIQFVLSERVEKNDPITTDNILSLTVDQGVIPFSERTGGGNKPKEDLSAYKIVHENDIVMNSMNVLAGSVGISKYHGVVSPVYYMLYNNSIVTTKYCNYIFQTEAFQKSLLGLGNGILIKESSTGKLNTIRMRIPMEKLKKQKIPLPSMATQAAIVSFLDAWCLKIDEIIAEARDSITEYQNWKSAVIFESVTKGIDKSSELKDSGIKWVGEMPATWPVRVLFQLVSQVKNKNVGMIENNLLSLSYGKIKRKDINTTDGLLPESFDGYNIVEPGDIVLRLTDLQNDHTSLRVGRATERGIVTYAYVTIRPGANVNSEYLYYLLHSYDIKKGFYGMGSGVRQGLNFDEVKLLKLPIPDVTTQKNIVQYLNEKCEEIDSVIAEKQKLISDLEKYKKSLIYEAVTGKRRVG